MSPALSWAAGCSPGGRIEQRLLRGPERDLDLNGHARCAEAEDLAAGVVPRRRRNPGVLVGERERLRHPAEGVGLRSARDERPKIRRDRPVRDVNRGVTGTRPAPAYGVEAEGGLGIAPGLGAVGGAVELNPAPVATGAYVRAQRQRRVVAVHREPDLPHVVVGTTAVGTG